MTPGSGPLGYVMNSYPMVSTTFIGREIAALEAAGHTVRRYAIRPWQGAPLVDPQDKAERDKTTYLLTGSKARLIGAALATLVTRPRQTLSALGLTVQLVRAARGGWVRHAAYLLEAMVLARRARQDGIRHLHAHFSTNSTAIAMLARRLGGPDYSFTLHGPDELFAPVENSLGRKVAEARRVVAISHFARSQIMLFSDPADWDKIAIVHCGVHPARYGQSPRAGYGKRVLFVGRLDAVKGGPLLLEAFARIAGQHPEARLDIIGDGAERPGLEARAAALGLTERVSFHGFLPQDAVARQMEASDMLILPSFAEGVPVVLMEAMASRLPVIASRVAGVQELVTDGVSGFVVAPGDLAGLAQRLDRLMADPALCARMGAAGRETVAAAFDIAAEAAWLARILAGGPEAAPPGQLRPSERAPDTPPEASTPP